MNFYRHRPWKSTRGNLDLCLPELLASRCRFHIFCSLRHLACILVKLFLFETKATITYLLTATPMYLALSTIVYKLPFLTFDFVRLSASGKGFGWVQCCYLVWLPNSIEVMQSHDWLEFDWVWLKNVRLAIPGQLQVEVISASRGEQARASFLFFQKVKSPKRGKAVYRLKLIITGPVWKFRSCLLKSNLV